LKYVRDTISAENYFSIGRDIENGCYCIEVIMTWVAWYSRYFEISEEEYYHALNELSGFIDLSNKLAKLVNPYESVRFLYSELAIENKTDNNLVLLRKAINKKALTIQEKRIVNKIDIDVLKKEIADQILEYGKIPMNYQEGKNEFDFAIIKDHDIYRIIKTQKKKENGYYAKNETIQTEVNLAIQEYIESELKRNI